MKGLLILLMVLAFFHFIYEAIIAPSLRFDLRFRLFAMRDELRAAKIQHPDEVDEEVFHFLQRTINNSIKHMHFISLKLVVSAWHLSEHADEMLAKLARIDAQIDSCPVPQVKAIRDRHKSLIGYAFVVNSGGWVIYLIPVIVGLLFFSSIMTLSGKILALPEREIEKIAPSDRPVWV